MQRIRIGNTQGSGPGGGKPPGLLARIAFAVSAVFVLAIAAFLGAFFLLIALGFFVVASVVVAFRVWRARRLWQKRVAGWREANDAHGRSEDRSEVIEGEYRILGEQGERPDPDRAEGGDR